MKKILAFAALLGLAACTDPSAANRALQNLGFTDIEMTGYGYLGCGRDDTYSTGFRAKNPQGRYVTGVVCSGWAKGSTVRFD